MTNGITHKVGLAVSLTVCAALAAGWAAALRENRELVEAASNARKRERVQELRAERAEARVALFEELLGITEARARGQIRGGYDATNLPGRFAGGIGGGAEAIQRASPR